MIQYEDKDLEGIEHLNRFKISSIQQCVTKHRSRKCAFCNLKGACTECANPRCRGKLGWYHLPCGLRNGTVQVNDKSFCGEKHALKERRSLEVIAGKRKQLAMKQPTIFTSIEMGKSQGRKVNLKKSNSLGPVHGQQSNLESRKPSDFLFIKVCKIIPLGSNVDEPSVYLDNPEIQDENTLEDTITDQSGDELSLSYNISAASVAANATSPGNVTSCSGEGRVVLEDDLDLSQSVPSSPVSEGIHLDNGDTIQEEDVNRSQESIDVDVSGVNVSLDTMFSEIEPFDSSQSQEQDLMNESGIANRSFNELVSAGSAECTISELACGSGEGRVIIKSDAFNDLDEKDASNATNCAEQEDLVRDSSVTLRASMTEFKTFGDEEMANPCDNCEIMRDQVKQMKHKFQFSVDSVSFYKGQRKLCKDENVHLKKRLEILKQQKTDALKEAESSLSASQRLEERLGDNERKLTTLQKANHMYKKEKNEKDNIIECLKKDINDQANVCVEKDQIIEAQRKRILALSHDLAKAEEEKTSLRVELTKEQKKEPTIDSLIEFLEKKKREEASNHAVENGSDSRKSYAKKRTFQEPESAKKRKRLDTKES